jgi:hypothetical protein
MEMRIVVPDAAGATSLAEHWLGERSSQWVAGETWQ